MHRGEEAEKGAGGGWSEVRWLWRNDYPLNVVRYCLWTCDIDIVIVVVNGTRG